MNSDSKNAKAMPVFQTFFPGSQQKNKCHPRYICSYPARNIIIIRGLKKEGSKEKIPTYFAANQSNKDQTKQTPACSSKHLALGHQTIDFQTEKKENQKLSIRGFSSTLEQSYLVSYAKWSENF